MSFYLPKDVLGAVDPNAGLFKFPYIVKLVLKHRKVTDYKNI